MQKLKISNKQVKEHNKIQIVKNLPNNYWSKDATGEVKNLVFFFKRK